MNFCDRIRSNYASLQSLPLSTATLSPERASSPAKVNEPRLVILEFEDCDHRFPLKVSSLNQLRSDAYDVMLLLDKVSKPEDKQNLSIRRFPRTTQEIRDLQDLPSGEIRSVTAFIVPKRPISRVQPAVSRVRSDNAVEAAPRNEAAAIRTEAAEVPARTSHRSKLMRATGDNVDEEETKSQPAPIQAPRIRNPEPPQLASRTHLATSTTSLREVLTESPPANPIQSPGRNQDAKGYAVEISTQTDRPTTQIYRPTTQTDRPPTQMDRPTTQTDRPPTQMDRPTTQMDRSPTQMDRPPTQTDRPPVLPAATDIESRTSASLLSPVLVSPAANRARSNGHVPEGFIGRVLITIRSSDHFSVADVRLRALDHFVNSKSDRARSDRILEITLRDTSGNLLVLSRDIKRLLEKSAPESVTIEALISEVVADEIEDSSASRRLRWGEPAPAKSAMYFDSTVTIPSRSPSSHRQPSREPRRIASVDVPVWYNSRTAIIVVPVSPPPTWVAFLDSLLEAFDVRDVRRGAKAIVTYFRAAIVEFGSPVVTMSSDVHVPGLIWEVLELNRKGEDCAALRVSLHL